MRFVYIDAENLHKSTTKKGWLIDRQRFMVYLKQKYKIDRIYYAIGYRQEFVNMYNYLEKLGFELIYKETILLPDGTTKGNVDIDIAIKAVFDICENGLTNGYLVTNDGDYNSLIKTFKDRGVFGGLLVPDAETASKLLTRQVKDIIDIQRLRSKIQKQKDPAK